ncbi:two-component system response regulator [Paenibacillus sp. 32O-W]|uniref:response regulator n=1 Tax=Paenibacillus sp. 32O-W TaxID=1695218 RepID=UPI0007202FF5|nr:response regulator [Paenibacillus sp. 32O-W]ALS29830.1 two-component system response regulator [Paenibacillus sp. 32O-W]
MFTVLVVDDEPNVRAPVRRMLSQMEGADRVLEAADGKQALELLKRHEVHLVITDIRMPGMDGLALAATIRGRYPDTEVYVLTGYAEFEYAQRAVEHRVSGYLLKPLSRHKLAEVFEAASRKYRLRRHSYQVNTIRSKALLEKRVHDLLHGVPLPQFDEGLIPPFERIALISFSTKDLRSFGETSVRSFIRNGAYDAFCRLGVPVVCMEERLVSIVLFAVSFDREAWDRQTAETSAWMEDKLRLPIRTGCGGSTRELADLSLMYIRSMVKLGFTEVSRRGSEARLSPIVRSLLDYVRSEYAGNALLADFAEARQVNANYLSNLFHQETGMTYTQYLTHYRLTEAKRLLRETNLKIYEVCALTGYRDPAYFSRLFKTVVGLSPNDYRLGTPNT